ncbi:hypothetical protein QNH20_18135 [Neobacillus sp. WH10]|nr:hypothetical protein [Neobacillus sp. WH10]WHY76032.1 hypothetical protein QNH20_18135 [Neobacillus sp. WH10]
MKRITAFLFLFILIALAAAGCSSKLDDESWKLNKNHQLFPDYVLNLSEKIQETNIMASGLKQGNL